MKETKNVIITNTDPANKDTRATVRVNGFAIEFEYGTPVPMLVAHLKTLEGITDTKRHMELLPVGHAENPTEQPINVERRIDKKKFKIVDLDQFVEDARVTALQVAKPEDLEAKTEDTGPANTPSLFELPAAGTENQVFQV